MSSIYTPTNLRTTINGITFNICTYMPEIFRIEHNTNLQMHAHYSDEFFYVYNGQLRLFLAHKNQELILRKGDLCIVPKGMYHCTFSEYAERISFESRIEIDRAAVDTAACTYRGVQLALAKLDTPYIIRAAYIDTLMARYRDLADGARQSFTVSGISVLLSVVMYAFDSIQAEPITPNHAKATGTELDERKMTIERHLCEYFHDSACLTMLADALSLSVRQTSRVVQEIMHKNFKELIVAERMRVADILIKSRKYSLEQIAEIVGYRSYSGFFTAYRKYFGKTPIATGAYSKDK